MTELLVFVLFFTYKHLYNYQKFNVVVLDTGIITLLVLNKSILSTSQLRGFFMHPVFKPNFLTFFCRPINNSSLRLDILTKSVMFFFIL